MGGGQILIADEEAWIRENGEKALLRRGFAVDSVSNAHELLSWLDRRRLSRDGKKGYSVDLDLLILGCNVLLERAGEFVTPVRSRIGAKAANTPVLILTTHECRQICFRSWRLPIVATKSKPFEATDLAKYVAGLFTDDGTIRDRELLGQKPDALESLTAREQMVLSLVCHGLTDEEIGNCLDISVQTVHTHVKRIIDKLGVRNRTEAAALRAAHTGPSKA